MKKILLARSMLVGLGLLLLVGCAGNETGSVEETSLSREAEEVGDEELETLTIAVLPIVEALPIFVAADGGYFEDAGVNVEVLTVNSALERDNLMQAGEIDAMLGETITTALLNQEETLVQSTHRIRSPSEGSPVIAVLAAPGSGIETIEDLAGVEIGISLNTLSEYDTYSMLIEAGLPEEDYAPVSVPAIPERFQLLLEGDIQAAALPEPFITAGLAEGATIVVSDADYPQYLSSVLTFSTVAITEKPNAVERFMAGYKQAVADMNADPESFRSIMIANVRIPEPIQDTLAIPQFAENSLPDEAEWNALNEWMIERELIDAPVSYAESFVTDYVE